MADLMIMIFMLMTTIIMMLYYSDIFNDHIFDDDGLRWNEAVVIANWKTKVMYTVMMMLTINMPCA